LKLKSNWNIEQVHHITAMSFSVILGNFFLAKGNMSYVVSLFEQLIYLFLSYVSLGELSTTNKVTHIHYITSIDTELEDVSLSAQICMFHPPSGTILPDNTLVFIYGKIVGQPKNPFLIEALLMSEYSNISLECIPDFPPRMSVVGHVSGNAESSYEGKRIFKILSMAWVRDKLQSTTLMFLIHSSFSFVICLFICM